MPIRPHGQRLPNAAAIDRDLHWFFGMTGDELPHLIVEGHRLAVDRDDHVAILEAAASARISGRHRCQMRVNAGKHADIAELESPLPGRGRRHLESDRLAVAADAEIDFAIGTRTDRDIQLLPGVDRVIVYRLDPIAGPHSRAGRRRAFRNSADDGRLILVDALLDALIEHQGREQDREQDVHGRSHDQHLEPLPFALREEFVLTPDDVAVLVAFDVVRILAGHLDVATEREGAAAVLRVAAPEADYSRIEPELKFEHADTNALGGEKVTQLVHEHENAKNERKRQ